MPLKYVYGQDALVADFVVKMKAASGFSPYAGFSDRNLRTIGIANSANELIAGIVYFNHYKLYGTIEMSVEAIPKQPWLTRTTMNVMFSYPFLQCGCQELITKTSSRSKHVLRMLKAMNFENITIPRFCGRNEDGVIAVLTIEKWVESKFFPRHILDEMVAKEVA